MKKGSRYVKKKKISIVQSLLFLGAGAGAGEKIPGAGQKRTSSATLGPTKQSRYKITDSFQSWAQAPSSVLTCRRHEEPTIAREFQKITRE